MKSMRSSNPKCGRDVTSSSAALITSYRGSSFYGFAREIMNEQTALWHIFKHKRGSEVWKQFHWEIQAVAEKRFNDRIDYSLRVKKNNNNPTTNLG